MFLLIIKKRTIHSNKIGGFMSNYTEQEVIDKMEYALNDVVGFYKNDFINYKGATKDTKILCTELVAEFVYNNIKKLESIETVTRKKSYKRVTHTGKIPTNESYRTEERLAIQLYNEIDEILDYQTPLKSTNMDKGLGKVDLLYKQDDALYLLELKKEDSKETLLRCIMEGYTYCKVIDHKKLLEDFDEDMDLRVKQAPLIFDGSQQHNELIQNRECLSSLIKKLEQDIFIIKHSEGKYEINKY